MFEPGDVHRSGTSRSGRAVGCHAPGSRHDAAVASTLQQADEAAVGGDYDGALSWLGLLEAIGDELPVGYESKRQAWLAAIAAHRNATRPESP
jgi:hypothetical protein